MTKGELCEHCNRQRNRWHTDQSGCSYIGNAVTKNGLKTAIKISVVK